MKKYELTYGADDFDKTLLESVTRTGCARAVGGCDATSAQKTTFDYWDRVETGKGFTSPVTWHTGDDDKQDLGIASTVGMSKSDGGAGKFYLGYNQAVGRKTGSFGVGLSVDGEKTSGTLELMDINGDGLPDKVYLDGDGVASA